MAGKADAYLSLFASAFHPRRRSPYLVVNKVLAVRADNDGDLLASRNNRCDPSLTVDTEDWIAWTSIWPLLSFGIDSSAPS